MTYTIKIHDKTKKAKSIINMLKALNEDYNFIQISQDKQIKSDPKLEKELEIRYKLFQKNPNGKDWNILKKELLSK